MEIDFWLIFRLTLPALGPADAPAMPMAVPSQPYGPIGNPGVLLAPLRFLSALWRTARARQAPKPVAPCAISEVCLCAGRDFGLGCAPGALWALSARFGAN